MKYNVRRVLGLIARSMILIFLLSSCSVLNEASDPVQRIHQGQSQQELLSLLGKPQARQRVEGDAEVWLYHRSNAYNDKVDVFVLLVAGRVEKFSRRVKAAPVAPSKPKAKQKGSDTKADSNVVKDFVDDAGDGISDLFSKFGF